MDPTALYYALSTIAQCAAALAALIGFLGMWRLDRLQDEERQAEDEVIAETLQLSNVGPEGIPYRGRAYFLQKARELVAELTPPSAGGHSSMSRRSRGSTPCLDPGSRPMMPCGIRNTRCYGCSAAFSL